ncbi:MAG TPA: hypothetical protein VMU30_11405 [Bacteroidota bacterium]|nr:hypothetical protein [Bacteroidota bacterium]
MRVHNKSLQYQLMKPVVVEAHRLTREKFLDKLHIALTSKTTSVVQAVDQYSQQNSKKNKQHHKSKEESPVQQNPEAASHTMIDIRI